MNVTDNIRMLCIEITTGHVSYFSINLKIQCKRDKGTSLVLSRK
jgi:hypothetical protein